MNREHRAGTILDRLLNQLDWGGRVRQNMALAAWPDVVGPTVAACCVAEDVRDGILYVRTPGSTWSQELSLLKHDILTRLNAKAGAAALRDIRFRVGSVVRPPAPEPPQRSSPADLEAVSLTDEDRAVLEESVREASTITDEHIRRVTLNLVERSIRLYRWQLEHGYRPCPFCGVPVPPGQTVCTICAPEGTAPAGDQPEHGSGQDHPPEP